MSKLAEIQEAVKAPKNKNNNFGKYKYVVKGIEQKEQSENN